MTSPFVPGPSILGNLEETAQPRKKPQRSQPAAAAPDKPAKRAAPSSGSGTAAQAGSPRGPAAHPAPGTSPDVSAAPDVPGGGVMPSAPSGPPHPVLAANNYWGNIEDLNTRVKRAYDAYTTAYGQKPPPNLIFDLALSPVSAEHFPAMFSVPLTRQGAKAKGVLTAHPPKSAAQVATEIEQAGIKGDYNAYISDNADLIHGFASDPKSAATIFKAMQVGKLQNARHASVNGPRAGSAQPGLPSDYGNPNNLVAPADRATYEAWAHSPGNFLGTAAGQIVQSLAMSPAGLFEVGKAVTLDTKAALHGDESFSRTRKIGKESAKALAEDARHPLRNPGYAFLDALGLLSAGAGTVERLTAAGRAAAEEGTVAARAGAAAKAMARKPAPKTATLTKGDLTVDVLLSDNPFAAAVQQQLIRLRQAGLDRNAPVTPDENPEMQAVERETMTQAQQQAEQVPLAAAGPIVKQTAQKIADAIGEQVSTETKMGRELRAQRTAETAIRNAVLTPMIDAAGWTTNAVLAADRLPAKIRRGLSRGEQKAIQVLATDDPDPLQVHRDFHESMIEAGIGDKAAHQRQLTDLKLAEKALANPSPRLKAAAAAVADVMDEQQRLKIEQFG
jgi:hypothetical protein